MAHIKTKPDWQIKLEGMDVNSYTTVVLDCDGYRVSFQNYIYKRKMVTAWYVDGSWKGEYSKKDNEIGKKFGRPMIIRPNTAKMLVIIRRFDGKAAYEKAKKVRLLAGYYNTWTSARSLISHLKKTCTEIKIIE